MRSRPPTLVTLVHRLIRDQCLFHRGDVVLCACSGGPDSTALLHALALLRNRIGHRLVAVGVDHGLRQEAGAELEVARSVADQCSVPFETVAVEVSRGGNLQAQARLARYDALFASAKRLGASVVATGHTADDRAETVLMRMLRGAGPRGLAVLAASSTSTALGTDCLQLRLVRPLIRCRRRDVMAHLRRQGLPHCQDPSNRDPRFLRVRIRHELLPVAEKLSPRVVEHLCALADMLHDTGLDSPASRGLDGAFADLKRSQQLAVARLLRAGEGRTTVRVSGGKDLELKFLPTTGGARGKK